MGLWVNDDARNPNHHTKECQHERHRTYGKPCPSIDKNGAASANAIVVSIAQNI